MDLKRIAYEHYKNPKKFHSKLLLFLLFTILILLIIVIKQGKTIQKIRIEPLIRKNANLERRKIYLIKKLIRLKTAELNTIFEIRIGLAVMFLRASGINSIPPLYKNTAEPFKLPLYFVGVKHEK